MSPAAVPESTPAAMRARIQERLLAAAPRWQVRVLDRVVSTQDTVRRLAERGAPDRTAVLAREQTAGRGRHGRRWQSPRDQGVYLSVLLRCAWAAADAGWLPLLAVVATLRALGDLGIRHVRVKPPNDVVTPRGKIAGILTEPRLNGSQIDFVVLGVGINVGQSEEHFSAVGLRGHATSCRMEGLVVPLEEVAARWLARFDGLYRPRPLSGAQRRVLREAWRAAGGPARVPAWE
ncbi:MAG: biotin--[acetyl-CoA-carboxylase] ligase [Kiritimatiellae bacterium]|nr:biotin--[acetyl-CoA-carboxylase] ligase [Kiritimatiellia bacterium]